MKVMITGASGRLGNYLLKYSPSWADIEVLLDPYSPAIEGYPWYRTDISDRDKTIMAVTCSSPDYVVHLAAMTDVDKCETDPDSAFKVNRDGTANIADSCRKCGAGMMYISTDYVFDGFSGPYDEMDVASPISVYGHSKLEGEKVCTGIDGGSAILRISVPFGKRLGNVGHNFVSWLIEELSSGRSVNIVDDQFTTPCYLDEFAETVWTMIEKRAHGIFHYGTSDRFSRYEMALIVCREMNFDEGLVKTVKTADINFKAKRPLESGFITEKIAGLMNKTPVTFGGAVELISENWEVNP